MLHVSKIPLDNATHHEGRSSVYRCTCFSLSLSFKCLLHYLQNLHLHVRPVWGHWLPPQQRKCLLVLCSMSSCRIRCSLSRLLGRQYKGTSCEGSVRCGRGGTHKVRCGHGGTRKAYQARSMSTNQNDERTCMEPRDLPGSEATGQNPSRGSVGEGVYSPSHF